MNISGKTKLLGLIGNPVEHSFSPFIHNMFAQELGIDSVYTTFKVENGELGNAIKGAKALNIQGMNVTVPYKMDVLAYMDEVDSLAEHIGAMNTIVRRDNKFIGYNTDALGLKGSLEHEGVNLKGESVLIIGAGGAARAVAVMCADAGAKLIAITNRTMEKAEALASYIDERYEVETVALDLELVRAGEGSLMESLKIAFQTTSVGMSPNIDADPLEDSHYYDYVKVAVDLIYNPTTTKFMEKASAKGAKAISGLGMLYFQAVKAYELWNDVVIPETVLNKCYKAFFEKMAR